MAYKVIFYPDKCIGCGNCNAMCSKYWTEPEEMKAKLIGGKPVGENYELELDKDLACNKDAEESCPTEAIEIKE